MERVKFTWKVKTLNDVGRDLLDLQCEGRGSRGCRVGRVENINFSYSFYAFFFLDVLGGTQFGKILVF